jgi:fumarate reductase subunit C
MQMNHMDPHTKYHPRWYRERVSTYWWMWHWRYFLFILRELSSLAVAWTVLLTLKQVVKLQAGYQSYAELQQWLRTPPVIVLNSLALAFVLYHAITWFQLAPRAMVLRVGGKRLPDAAISLPNYALWLIASAGVVWVVLRG